MNLKPKLQDYLDSTQWKSQDLKVLLDHRKLSTSGYKSTLVDRLVDYLTNISMQEDLESLDPDIEEMTKKELVLECWLYFIQDIGRKNRGELLDALDDCIENGEKSEYLIQFDDADDNNENGAEDEFKFQWPKQSILKNLDFLEVGELCEIYNVVCIEPLKNCLQGFEDKTKDNIEDNNMTKNSNNDNKNTKTKRKNNSKSTKKSKNKSKNKNDNKNTKKKRKLASRLERHYDGEDDLTDDDDDDDDSDEEMEQDYDNGNDNSRSDDNGEDEDEDDDEDDGLYISQYNADKMAKYLDSKIDCYKVLVKLRKDCQKLLKLFEKHNYDGNSNDINNGDDLSTIRSDMICGDKEYWVGCPKRMYANSNYNFNYNFSNSNSNSYYFNRRGVSPDEGIFGIFNSNTIAQEWIKKVENRNMLKDKFSQFNVTKGRLGIDIEIYGCIAGQVWDETNEDNEDEKDNFGIEYNDTNRNKNKTSTGGNDNDSDGDDDDDYDYDLLTNNNQNKKKKKSRNETDKNRNKHNSKSKSKNEKQEKNSSNDNKNKTVSKRRSKSKVKKSKTELIDDDSESQSESESEENDIEMQDDDIDILTSKDRNNTSTVVLSDDDLDHYDDEEDDNYNDNGNDDFGYNGPRRISHTRSRRALN